MPEEFTDHYGLQRLTTDDLSRNSFRFSEADRVLIDRLLYLGAEGHHHTGGAVTDYDPEDGLSLELDDTAGYLPAGTRIYYKFSYVDLNGIETVASPETFIDTPSGVATPGVPTLAYATTGGTLQAGPYYYVFTAYETSNSRETLAGAAAFLAIPFTTNTNEITITLPTLPSGADGFNVYRKSPASVGYRYLTSVDMAVATPPSELVDDGSVSENTARPLPTTNTTVNSNSVRVTIPGATPVLPDGYGWRIYRTYATGDYTNSLITTVYDSFGYVDTGLLTTFGEPKTTGTTPGNPTQILLTDGAEVQGTLPAEYIEQYATSTVLGTEFGWFNVKAYGAEGDGSTDDTDAIQACIDASTAGSVVYFPPGVYLTSDPIALYEERTYLGAWAVGLPSLFTAPYNTTVRAVEGHPGPAVFQLRDTSLTFRASPAYGVRVRNLVADCSVVTQATPTEVGGFLVEGDCQDVEIASCAAVGAELAHGFHFLQGSGSAAPTNVRVLGNVASGNAYSGFRYEAVTDSYFQNNLAVSNGAEGYAGFWWTNSADNTIVSDRAVTNEAEGFLFDGTSSGQTTVVGPSTDGNAGDGLVISQSGTHSIQVVAPRLHGDGTDGGATPNDYAALKVTGQGATPALVCPVEIVTGHSTVGSSDTPQWGVYVELADRVNLVGGEWWGVDGGLEDGGSNMELRFQRNTRFFSGNAGVKTREFPDVVQGEGETITLRSGADTWTNMPSSETEFLGAATSRVLVDLTDRNYYRWFVNVATVGATGAFLKVQYTIDLTGASGWTDLTGTQGIDGSIGMKLSSSGAIPTAAKAPVLLRIAGDDGDAAADPVFTGIGLIVRA